MDLSTEKWAKIMRGVSEVISEAELKAKLAKGKPLRIKMGVDPTAPDLHLGHLVCLRKLRDFQDLGHIIQFIIGDFTARIGDPSGRSATRPPLSAKQVWDYAQTYQDQVFRVLDKTKTEVRFNSSWLNALGMEGFFQLQSRATIAQMLKRADFAKRVEEGNDVSLLEIMYPIMQGYDSVAVQADLELGGTDQKFNLLMGREIQKDYQQELQVVMTMPLLEGLDGIKKMSKSYGNYVAFNDTPQDMFGKLMSVPDALMSKYAELLTDLDGTSLAAMHPREAKALLARTLTAQFHGADAAQAASDGFDRVFSKKEIPEEMSEVRLSVNQDFRLSDVLAQAFGLSKNEARRLLDQKAVEIDGQKVELNHVVRFLNANDASKVVQAGKRRFVRLVPGA